MRPTLKKTWSSCQSLILRTREISHEGAELEEGTYLDLNLHELILTSAVNSWHKALTTEDASCEAALKRYASLPCQVVLDHLQSSSSGLSDEEASRRLEVAGANILTAKKPPIKLCLFFSALHSPFNYLLLVIAIISAVVPDRQWATVGVIIAMIIVSSAVQFWQELKSTMAAVQLQANLLTQVYVRRICDGHGSESIAVDEKSLVPGDIISLNPGDGVSADCMLIESSNLSISQSGLTGESEPQKKTPSVEGDKGDGGVLDLENIVFMGTHVISGTGLAIVLRTGDGCFIATIMQELNKKRPINSFQRSIKQLSYMMGAFMIIITPIVLVINYKTSRKWLDATVFAISTAIGVIPEMLPAIVNTNLARGALAMKKKGAVVKQLDAIQNLGAMTCLCSDKTGTLTRDEIALTHSLDNYGTKSHSVFELAYVNAMSQSGKKNSIDSAIIHHPAENERDIAFGKKVGEISFNFESRRSSCIIQHAEQHLLICKGAAEEVYSLCNRVRLGTKVAEFDDQIRGEICKRAADFNSAGYRVILVASKILEDNEMDGRTNYEGLDSGLVLEGLLTFLDTPKEDAKASIARLQVLGVDVRVLTGDNLGVAMKVCRTLELVKEFDEEKDVVAINGHDLAQLEDEEFDRVVKSCKIFAKLTPTQKGQVVKSLQKQGEIVGMLGDGINDCVALRDSDAGISVDTGANASKDCADMVLTQKQLAIIVDCVRIGRTTQGNTIKYLKMVTSSNFGSVLSLVIASAWLPYQPMTALQLIIQSLLYDFSQIAIPWDHMDEEYLAVPRGWSLGDVLRYVVVVGPTSTVIDILIFALNKYFYGLNSSRVPHEVALAQTHWFLMSLITQTIVIYLLRTAKIPLVQSRPVKSVIYSTSTVMVIGLLLPYIPVISKAFGFVYPAGSFFGFTAAATLLYCIEVQFLKVLYIKLFKTWI